MKLTKLWKSRRSPSLKVHLLRSTAFAIASYGSESWTMKLADKKRVDSFELRCGDKQDTENIIYREENKHMGS